MEDNAIPSKQLVLQRVRNRIIEYFELAADPQAQAQFGPNTIINYWQDWQDLLYASRLPEPVFSASEHSAMQAFDLAWHTAADTTSNPMPSIVELRGNPIWQLLTSSAASALAVFAVRGRLPEDHEAVT